MRIDLQVIILFCKGTMSMKTVCSRSFYSHMAMMAFISLHLAGLVSLVAAAPLNDTLCEPVKFQADNTIGSAVNTGHSFSDVNTICGLKVKLSLMEKSTVSAVQLNTIRGSTSSSKESRGPTKIRVYLTDSVHEVILKDNESNATISINSPWTSVDTIVIHSTPPACFKTRLWMCNQQLGVESNQDRQPLHPERDSHIQDKPDPRLTSPHRQYHHIQRRRAASAAAAVKRSSNDRPGDITYQTYSWLPLTMAGVFSVTLLAILPALLVVSICCHNESRKKRTQDKDLIVRETLPFNPKNNPMKARRESQGNSTGARRYEIDPLGAPTISTFHDQRGSVENPTQLEYTLFSTSPTRSPPTSTEHGATLLPHSEPVQRMSMSASEHISVSSFAPKHKLAHSIHSSSPSHTVRSQQAAAIHSSSSHDSHPTQSSTFTAVPRPRERRDRNTDSYSSNASGISYVLTGARLSELSDLSTSLPSEGVGEITTKQTEIVSTRQQNTTTEAETTTVSKSMNEPDENNPIVTQRRPTFTVKVYQHSEKKPPEAATCSVDVPLQSSMTTLPSSSLSSSEARESEVPAPRTRPFSEGDIIDETSLDKGRRTTVSKPIKGVTSTKQEFISPSKDAKKKKQTKKTGKKKAPVSPPHTPPPPLPSLPPLPPLPITPPTANVHSESEREAGKKSRAQTPIAARTMEVHTPTNKLHTKVYSPPPPSTPPPLPPLPPLPTTPLTYQFQRSVFSAQKSPDMIFKCSNCGQEIKDNRNDSAHSSPKTNSDYSSDKLPLKRNISAPPYHILQSGSVICMECLMKDGPIYNELEVPSDEEVLDETTMAPPPPIPARDYPPPPPKPRDPVYERVGSLSKKDHPDQQGAEPDVEENSTTRSRKPKSLVLRTGSSTDYESIPSLNSPNNHRAMGGFSQLTSRYPGHRTLPPLHLQLPASGFMEDMLESNEQHDYESLTTIDQRHIAVNMGAMGERRGSHDYACIGAAPSMEDLPSPDSPPFVPEGAKRVQLLKIDSQGYASVMPLQDDHDEIDCLTFSDQREQCRMKHSELPTCRENDMWKYDPGYAPLVPRRESGGSTHSQASNVVPRALPQDYEVPLNCLPSIEQTSRRSSHALTRQSALTSTEDDQHKRSLSSHQRGTSDVGTQSDHDLEDTEEVFDDSGIETSVDLQEQVSRENKRWNQHDTVDGSGVKTTTTRASSLGNTGAVVEMDESYHRPRAITLHNVKFCGEDMDQAGGEKRKSSTLRISLDQTSQAVV